MQDKPTLYLLRGVCGSGKTTLAKDLVARGFADRWLEADQYFMNGTHYVFDASKLKNAHEWCQTATKHTLLQERSVVVSNTSTTEKEVAVYQQIAKDYDANFVSLIVENRNDTKNVHNVPEEKIQQMKDRFNVKL